MFRISHALRALPHSHQQSIAALKHARASHHALRPIFSAASFSTSTADASQDPKDQSAGQMKFGKYVTVEHRPDNIAIIRLDTPDSKVNTLSGPLMAEFEKVLDHLAAHPSVRGAVLTSAKQGNFIAGADITMLSACQTSEELSKLAAGGQQIMDRIANNKIPIVAAINGTCLGGGLEVALACHSRVVTSDPKTTLGLPEVMLGLLPGSAGTWRLPRQIGLSNALPLLLTGQSVRPDRARRLKLVDSVADPFALESAAIKMATSLADQAKTTGKIPGADPHNASTLDKVVERVPFARKFFFQTAKKQTYKKTHGNYPAHDAILAQVEEACTASKAVALASEARRFGDLGMTPESRALVSLFFGQTALKKNRFGKPSREYKKIGVLGAGLMGAGIAQVSLERGFDVVLKDRDLAGLARGMQQIRGNLDTKVKRRQMNKVESDAVMSRLAGVTDVDAARADRQLASADMVIEAVFEDLSLKHRVLGHLEQLVQPHTVIASNTSALPIRDICAGLQRPENVVGMHYFSPVDKMQLLEVITTDKTSAEAKSAAVEVGIKQGKLVIVVRDGPGFYTTRILSPMMNEAGLLLQQGVPVADIDRAMQKYGFPVGPIKLFDEVGIDVGNRIQPTLEKAFGARMSGASTQMLLDLQAAGFLGRKSGRGFFDYAKGKNGKETHPEAMAIVAKYKVDPAADSSPEDYPLRMTYRLVNEALFCLEDGTLSDPLDGDMGAVFGLGFPPFRGGPFRMIDTIGAQNFVDTMNRFAKQYGPRFTPCPLVVQYAKEGKKFYPTEKK